MSVEYRTLDRFPGYRFGSDGSAWKLVGDSYIRLAGWLNHKGYCEVKLRGKCYRLHRLTLEAFAGPCPPGMEGMHSPDPTRTNNAITNLRWGTSAENRQDCMAQGRANHTSGAKAATNCKLTPDQVREIRRMHAAGAKAIDLAPMFGVARNTIYGVISGRKWKFVA